MELHDFSFFAWAPISLIPLVSIYFCLKSLDWQGMNRLFIDAWYFWLAWFVSTILAYASFAIVDVKSLGTLGIPLLSDLIALFYVFLVNLLFVGGLVKVLNGRIERDELHLFENEKKVHSSRSSPLIVSFIATTVATVSMLIIFGLATIIDDIYYDRFHEPQQKTSFHIYD